MTAKTTIIINDEPTFSTLITYIFKSDSGEVISIEGKNYADARRKLNKQTDKKGFSLKERRL